MNLQITYQFSFNNDIESCEALSAMISDGWILEGYKEEDGHRWLIMKKYRSIA